MENGWLIVTTKDGGSVNIRSGPGTEFPAIGKAKTGEMVVCVPEFSGWNYVRYDGRSGYMCSDYLKPYESTPDQEQEDKPAQPEWLDSPSLTNESGQIVSLSGKWCICID